ncbi:MAG: AAA family ATPase [Actinomycetota bacterium]|nr:AAA family ATPase [Actinomycetota bacterium]
MNLAIVGKGGAGKTSISGTLARLLARRGHRVVAIDGDPNPNLAFTLGIPPDRVGDIPGLTRDLVEYTEKEGYRLTKSFAEVCTSHAVAAPDGVTLLAMGIPQQAGTG